MPLGPAHRMARLFDKQASVYASSRPTYPPALYDFLTSLTPRRSLAWDVGTGSGQAALSLSERFDRVIATDPSEEQLKQAPQLDNVAYAVTAENLTIQDALKVVGEESSVDLITVAQALHWFDLESFHSVATRLLRKPGGIMAAWTYYLVRVDAEVDAVTDRLYAATQPYWAPQRRYVDEMYRTIAFPYVAPPALDSTGPFEFKSEKELDMEGLLVYFQSWSAVQTALDAGIDFVEDFRPAFEQAWGPDLSSVKTARWPIFLRAGAVPQASEVK